MRSVHLNRAFRVATAAIMLVSVCGQRAEAVPIASTTMQVVAGVNINCTIATFPLNFGVYRPTSTHASTPLNGTGGVYLNCTNNGNNVRVRMGQGLYPAAGSTDAAPLRQMGSAANRLSYQLYADSNRTVVWNNSPPGQRPTRPYPTTMPVYGQIPPGQVVPPGAYSDTVVVTVLF